MVWKNVWPSVWRLYIYNLNSIDNKYYTNLFDRYGTWGVCFTYGAFFAIRGLVAVGRTYGNSISVRNGCRFLLSKQLSAGGWGEGYLSSENEVNIYQFCLIIYIHVYF